MITNEEGLKKSRHALELVQGAYDCLRRDLKPKNERNFQCFAQADLELLLDIRDDIDAYLGLKRTLHSARPTFVIDWNENVVAEVRGALAQLEAVLDSVRLNIKPTREALYRALSQPLIDQILNIRDQLDAHLGIHRPVYGDELTPNGTADRGSLPSPEPAHAG